MPPPCAVLSSGTRAGGRLRCLCLCRGELGQRYEKDFVRRAFFPDIFIVFSSPYLYRGTADFV